MKAIIQRVMNAKVTVNGEDINSIGQGACIFVGLCNTDTVKDIEFMARKILSIKLFDDIHDKRWKKSIVDNEFDILCVSQFTLYNTWKGNKPDFHHAMPSEKSREYYDLFMQLLRDNYKPEKVKGGIFGAYMQVALQNDGPVTLELESSAQNDEVSKKTKKTATAAKSAEAEDNADR